MKEADIVLTFCFAGARRTLDTWRAMATSWERAGCPAICASHAPPAMLTVAARIAKMLVFWVTSPWISTPPFSMPLHGLPSILITLATQLPSVGTLSVIALVKTEVLQHDWMLLGSINRMLQMNADYKLAQ